MREMIAAILRAADPLPYPHVRYRTKIHPQGFWYQPFSAKDPGVSQMDSLDHYFHPKDKGEKR